MQISKKYLEQYFDLTAYSNTSLATKLTDAGFEVEAIHAYDFGDKLVVGYVMECQKHPDSDHLSVCQVDVKEEVLQIVCGANNVAKGQKVIVAKNGCKLSEFTIKKSKIRGIESNGMLCSLVELGVDPTTLSETQKNGIEILPQEAIIGSNPLVYVGLDDVIFELGITPNRSETIALNAMLYEISAILRQKLVLEIPSSIETDKITPIKVMTESKYCDYISAQKVDGITIKPASMEIQTTLQQNGVKTLNNVVDISNYVMLLTGQPNHIYDARFVKGSLRVVDNYEGEFLALDGNIYHIEKGDLMIFDDEKPLGIAGIMGGEYSKIVDDTKDVIIEIASFARMRIRNTARRLNINSDSSVRYQKNIDPLASTYASGYLTTLLKNEAEAKLFYQKVESSPKVFEPTVLSFSLEKLNTHLGTSFIQAQVEEVFTALNFPYSESKVTIPSYRLDITIEEDLYEEIIRLLGYEHLPTTLPVIENTIKQENKLFKNQRAIMEYLNKMGISEAITYTLVSDVLNALAISPSGKTIQLAAPLSEERKNIRRSILPSLLESIAYNVARNQENIALYEVSDVTSETTSENRVAIAISGNLQENKWNHYQLQADFYVMKSILYTILQQLGFDKARIFIQPNTENTEFFHPYQSASIYIAKQWIGTFGMVHPKILKQYDIKNTVAAEFDLSKLTTMKVSKLKYQVLSKYPSLTRDIALLADLDVTFDQLKAVIQKVGKQLVKEIEVFDIYQGEYVEAGKKSIAIRVLLQSDTATLETNQVNEIMNEMIQQLEKTCNVTLRS